MHVVSPESDTVVIIMARVPVPGDVKTRLIPALGVQGACDVYSQLLQHTLRLIPLIRHVDFAIYWEGDMQHACVQQSLDMGARVYQQQPGDLGQRMLAACHDQMIHYRSIIIIGTDCPSLDPQHLESVIMHLQQGCEVVITPAEDGGYVLIAMNHVHDELFSNVSWGSDTVFSQTQCRLDTQQIRWQQMPVLWDVDLAEDLQRWYALQDVLYQQRLPCRQ